MTTTALGYLGYPQSFGPWSKRQPPSAAIEFSGRFEKPHYQTTSGILRLEVRQRNSKSYNHQRNLCNSTAFRWQARPLVIQLRLSHLVGNNSRNTQLKGLPGGFERGR